MSSRGLCYAFDNPVLEKERPPSSLAAELLSKFPLQYARYKLASSAEAAESERLLTEGECAALGLMPSQAFPSPFAHYARLCLSSLGSNSMAYHMGSTFSLCRNSTAKFMCIITICICFSPVKSSPVGGGVVRGRGVRLWVDSIQEGPRETWAHLCDQFVHHAEQPVEVGVRMAGLRIEPLLEVMVSQIAFPLA